WMTDLSVVIPVYNEEDNLPLLWPELRSVLEAEGLAFEVVFVDDGSRDRSAEIIRSLRESDPRVRLVRLKANAGETAATDARMRGYRVLEVPVRNRPRRFGQSKYGVLNRVFVAAVDLLVVRWMKSRTLHYEVAEDLGGDLIRE